MTNLSQDSRGALLLVTTAHPSLYQHRLGGEVHPNLGRLIQPRHTSSAPARRALPMSLVAQAERGECDGMAA